MTDKEKQRLLEIQRVYIKHMSLEVVDAPQVFTDIMAHKDWNPEIKIDIKTEHSSLDLDEDVFEVILCVSVTVAPKDTEAILHIKVEQAGIFCIAGFDDDETAYLLATHCPEILFPYAREAISSLVARASFPQLNLRPVNFEALYEQQKSKPVQVKQ